jgi:alginate O-acetyltransferase complex protein AlgJ
MTAKFIVGKNDYLFLDNDTNKVLHQTVGKVRIPSEILDQYFQFHTEIAASGLTEGYRYLYIIAPNKETALRELLPDDIRYEADGLTPVKVFQRRFPQSSDFLFFNSDFLCPQNSEFATYDRGDSHWTPQGALAYMRAAFEFFEATELCTKLEAVKVITVNNRAVGDLGKHAGRDFEDIEQLKLISPYSEIIFEGPIVNEGYIRHVCSRNGAKKALVFHDSFAQMLMPLLSEMFEQTLFVHTPDYIPELVAAFQPDYIVRLQAERFFPRPPTCIESVLDWIQSLEAQKGVNDSTFTHVRKLLSKENVAAIEKPSKPKVLFCHIPKNAGTSIAAHLVSQYQWSEIFGLDGRRVLLQHLIQNQRAVAETHKLISGHIPLSRIEEILDSFDLILAIIRPPMERLISQHQYWVKQSYVRPDITLEEFFAEVYAGNAATRNEQCGFIGYKNDFQSAVAREKATTSLRLIPYHALDRLNKVATEFHLPPFTIKRLNASKARANPWLQIDTPFYKKVFDWFADDFLLYDYVLSARQAQNTEE